MKTKLALCSLVCGVLAAPGLSAEIRYAITDLGACSPSGLNNSGQVVGRTADGQAFLYSGGSVTNLGLGVALALNDRGQVVGALSNQAFLYSDGTMISLGTLGGPYSEACAINNSGQVVGRAYTSDNIWHAFLYSGTNLTDLGTPLGGYLSRAYSINDRGQIVGEFDVALPSGPIVQHAFLYSAGSMSELGTNGFANAINTYGEIVGASVMRACRFSGSNSFDLGTLGGMFSDARSLNNSGQAVGWAHTSDLSSHACLFDDTGAIDLNSLIDPAAGWTLTDALGINDRGQIVGTGTNPSGQSHGFLLTPFRTLFLNRQGTALALSWFTNAPQTLSLVQSADLAATNWVAVTNTPMLINDQYQVLISPLPNGSQFFRLQSQ